MSAPPRRVEESTVRAVRQGHGANCSSIGSVIDTLFVTALAGGAVFAAVMAALGTEPVEERGPRRDAPPAPERDPDRREDTDREPDPGPPEEAA